MKDYSVKRFRFFFNLILVLLLYALVSLKETNYPKIFNNAFKEGEKLRYFVSYGFLDAGEVTIEVKSTSKKGNKRSLYHCIGKGRTTGIFSAFYKVKDVYQSYIDKESIMPWFFIRDVNEGGYKIKQNYVFKQNLKKVNNGIKEFKVPMGIQDMVSSFYKSRTLNFDKMKPGKIFSFKCFMDDEIYDLKIKYLCDEKVKVRLGSFKCHKFVPVVQEGRYFKSEDDVKFWISADKNKIPILIKAKIPVGSLKLHLVDFQGLKNKMKSKI